jgi:cardiolipin synthase
MAETATHPKPKPKRRLALGDAPARGEVHRFWLYFIVTLIFVIGGYFWMTSARILDQPIELSYGPSDPSFQGSFGPLVGAEFSRGNKIKVLVNGAEFFPAMLDAIRHAQKTITLETYIWSSGSISNQFMDALSERAQHGVKVDVLVDGMGTLKLSHAEEAKMKQAGVVFIVFGREHWYDIKPNINHRTHRKILVVDGKVGFTGGNCIDDHWLGDAQNTKVWRDTQIQIEGPAVLQLQAVFADNWLQTTGKLLTGPDYFPPATRDGDSLANCYKSGPDADPENARVAYLLAIAAARKTIRIANAYFVPDDLAIEMLVEARRRGVQVQIIVPAVNDSRIGRAASRSRWGKLLAAGCEFYRYTPAMYHCKVMIVDDIYVTVGSVNFDNRSFSINDEVAADILDRKVAADMLKSFAEDLKKSVPYSYGDYEARPWYEKAGDWTAGLIRSQL